ncbi:DUF6807 domain-containing protein [Stieleria varia]|uniref:Methane oxygenase PmoA n=1 Tax=Stieleria varia TaxID=2528005 RepID=A0A5C6AQ95_9BACT|nr:PmoA family protein [Stieleria varia]TWU02125.1 hypothetical protein Pla52n_31740 [Stieleria varia]
MRCPLIAPALTCFSLVPIFLCVTVIATLSHAGEVAITETEGKAVVTLDGKPFAEYRSDGYAKPIVYPIIGPHGIPMTRSYPMEKGVDNEASDHPHHKSLWYTHDEVNGVRFWMEGESTKENIAVGKIVQTSMKIEGNTITTTDDWVGPDGKVVCSDTRTLTFGGDDNDRHIDVTVQWRATNGEVHIGDTKEGTMGIRTNPLLRLSNDPKRGNHTAKGKAINSEGVEGKDIWGKRAKWVDYWAPVNDHVVGVAIFDHPSNPKHPTWWHARNYGLVAANPFGVHDFEGKPKGTGDVTIPAGESLTFRYRFLFHTGDVQSANIAAKYADFAETK